MLGEQPRKEFLRQIFGVVRWASLAPAEGIKRIPIGRAQAGERVPGGRAVVTRSRGQDRSPMGGLKPGSGRGEVTTRWTSWRHLKRPIGTLAIVLHSPAENNREIRLRRTN